MGIGAIFDILRKVGAAGKDICPWFNIKAGTRNSCSKKHVCAHVPAGKKDCCGRTSAAEGTV